MQKNENPFVLAGILLVITAAVALLLAFTNSVTEDKIEQNTIKEQNEARQSVMAAAKDFTKLDAQLDPDGVVKEIYEGKDGETTVGYCVSVAPNGFGGAIDMIVGISSDKKVTGIKIVSMAETPGLGAKAQDDAFSGQFADKPATELKVIKSGTAEADEIVAISGATISSAAVTRGVNEAVKAVENLK